MDLEHEVSGFKHDLTKIGGAIKDFIADNTHELGGIRVRLDELEQKGARRPIPDSYFGASGAGRGSPGAIVVASEDYRRFLLNKRGTTSIPIGSMFAAITSMPGVPGSAAALVPPDYRPDPVLLPQRKMTIRDLLTIGRTSSRSVEYAKETLFDNQAAPVAEGAAKPESNLEFTPETAPVRKLAHFVVVTKEALDDAPSLQSTIDSTLRYGLQYVEEQQLLFGDGTGENLHGLVPQATAFASPIEDPALITMIDVLGQALAQAELAELPASGIVLNSQDYRQISMLKTTTGEYIGAGPFLAGAPSLWNLPVVSTNSMARGHFLVGAFATAATIYDREDAEVLISTEDNQNFRENKATILAEERLALAVRRPEALIYGAFPGTPPAT